MPIRHLVLFCSLVLPGAHAHSAKPAAPAKPPPEALRSILGDVAAAGFGVDGDRWTAGAPWACTRKRPDRLCRPVKRFMQAIVRKQFEKKEWALSLWSLEFATPKAAKAWAGRFEHANDDVFGKAPVTTFLCGTYVLATEGVFRGPMPHRMLDKAVRAAVARRCASR